MKVVNINLGERYTVYIGRGSILGNDWTHLPLSRTKAKYQVATRAESIACFEADARKRLETDPKFRAAIERLSDDDVLGCYCEPDPCHGRVIIKLWQELKGGRHEVAVVKKV